MGDQIEQAAVFVMDTVGLFDLGRVDKLTSPEHPRGLFSKRGPDTSGKSVYQIVETTMRRLSAEQERSVRAKVRRAFRALSRLRDSSARGS